ncbi:MAG: Zn-ribbon domain-containing OB-fold protein [Bacillota bacterium]
MAILERITKNIDNRYWDPGVKAFPVKNRYTAGVAGQWFFEELKDNGKIYGSRCKDCEITYVPPRLYCERCFKRLEKEKDWLDVGTEGELYSFTVVHKTKSGEEKEEPSLIAAVKIADGLLVHRLTGIKPEEAEIGMKVVAELKPQAERQGKIKDIKHFKPL